MNSDEAVVTDEQLPEVCGWVEGIAREAGDLLRESIHRVEGKNLKRKRELVTSADCASENLIVSRLRKRYPDHSICTEETGGHETDSRYRWWVDPLDGTNSFAHGHPHFSISIALEETDEGLILGVVHDPMRDECFSAVISGVSRLNGKDIHVSDIPRLADSLAATGFPYDREADNVNNLPEFNQMIMAIQGIRRGGSAALDLCYVAAGRLDAYWERKLKTWDVAAGGLIAIRAGGVVTNIGTDRWDPRVDHIAASNGQVHEEMQRILIDSRAQYKNSVGP